MEEIKSGADKVMVSVIVPTYNHEKYISKALDSILSQRTGYSFEVLVGDDCSTDNTRDAIKEYCAEYPEKIRAFFAKRNQKATRNGYHLMREARGKYLAFCDGDDCWCDESRLEREVSFLEKNPGYSGICGRVCLIDEEDREIDESDIAGREQFWQNEKKNFSYKDFEKWKMPGQISALVMRNFMRISAEEYSIYYKAHPMVGDRTLILFAVLQGKIRCVENVVSCYRYRVNQTDNFMSQYKQKNLYGEDFLLMRKLERFVRRNFHKRLDLSGIKKDRLAAAVVRVMKTKKAEDCCVVWQIVKNSDDAIKYLFYTGKILVLKWYYWNVTGEDHRITL